MNRTRLLSGAMLAIVAFAAAAAGQVVRPVPGTVTVAVSGVEAFTGTLKGSCQINAAERTVYVTAKGESALVRFSVHQSAAGPLKVVMEGLGKPKESAFVYLSELSVGPNRYIASQGSGSVADAAGRAGKFHAEGFIKGGASLATLNLKADVAWKCE